MRLQVSLFFSESPTNPYLRCVDVPRIKQLCAAKGAVVVVDSTFATPINQQVGQLRRFWQLLVGAGAAAAVGAAAWAGRGFVDAVVSSWSAAVWLGVGSGSRAERAGAHNWAHRGHATVGLACYLGSHLRPPWHQ